MLSFAIFIPPTLQENPLNTCIYQYILANDNTSTGHELNSLFTIHIQLVDHIFAMNAEIECENILSTYTYVQVKWHFHCYSMFRRIACLSWSQFYLSFLSMRFDVFIITFDVFHTWNNIQQSFILFILIVRNLFGNFHPYSSSSTSGWLVITFTPYSIAKIFVLYSETTRWFAFIIYYTKKPSHRNMISSYMR